MMDSPDAEMLREYLYQYSVERNDSLDDMRMGRCHVAGTCKIYAKILYRSDKREQNRN